MYAVDSNYKLFRRVVLDGQGVKEGLQEGMRILNSKEVEDGLKESKEQALSAFKKSLMTLIEMQKYCKLVFSKTEIAERFSPSKDNKDLSNLNGSKIWRSRLKGKGVRGLQRHQV